ncbi:MAG: matrixin family metalloprotease [Alphaproteobacteria bacterium]|nr:matrixin family metalloprotease [Alphaproteobacteria bacterium]
MEYHMTVKNAGLFFLVVLIIASCRKEEHDSFSVCNDLIFSGCDGSTQAAYCLFGLRWDKTNSGQIQTSDSLTLSYSFLDSGYMFNTHSQENVTSLSFDQVIPCSKESVRKALLEWASVAPLKFAETTNNEKADIRIAIADISQGGLGYPPFTNEPCKELAGLCVIRPIANATCDSYYCLALHEIGHILGLGHILSNNVMNPNKCYKTLQQGDIQGIQALYGK